MLSADKSNWGYAPNNNIDKPPIKESIAATENIKS
jgi:hypothetical protein